jgi:hypothetical protein
MNVGDPLPVIAVIAPLALSSPTAAARTRVTTTAKARFSLSATPPFKTRAARSPVSRVVSSHTPPAQPRN